MHIGERNGMGISVRTSRKRTESSRWKEKDGKEHP
jgi:hypothetical protein